MVDNANDNKLQPAPQQIMVVQQPQQSQQPQQDTQPQQGNPDLGKPTPKWKTTAAQVHGALGVFGAIAAITLGAVMLVKGRAITHKITNSLLRDIDSSPVLTGLQKSLHAVDLLKVEKSVKQFMPVIALGTIGGGMVGGAFANAEYSSGKKAAEVSDTIRSNYNDVKQQLDQQQVVLGRGI